MLFCHVSCSLFNCRRIEVVRNWFVLSTLFCVRIALARWGSEGTFRLFSYGLLHLIGIQVVTGSSEECSISLEQLIYINFSEDDGSGLQF